MNVADSGIFAECLQKAGCLPAGDLDEAEIVIINTCTVRQHAEDRALSEIGQLKKWKDKDSPPGCRKILIVAGCVAERLKDQIKKRFPHVDIVIGAKDVEHIPEILETAGIAGTGISAARAAEDVGATGITQAPGIAESSEITEPGGQTQAVGTGSAVVSSFVTITRGCNNFCSYCIVPYVRGSEKHRPVQEIISEIECLVARGVKEVTLLGQNVNSYLHTDGGAGAGINFSRFLDKVNSIKGLLRIRFLTSHPKDFTDDIIDAIASLDKVCEHIHLPLQSGSDRILNLMNRKYTAEYYLQLLDKIRKKIPDVGLTTDLLVGFPSETDDDFSRTLDVVKSADFDFAYVFKYSPRHKATSSQLNDDVPVIIKQKRHALLLELCNEMSVNKNKKFIGQTVEILAGAVTVSKTATAPESAPSSESVSASQKGKTIVGKTRDNRTVVVETKKFPGDLIGNLINVKITGSRIHSLTAHLPLNKGHKK